MNIYTKQIMELLKIDADVALKVQRAMEEAGLDFSECSTKEFNRCARECHYMIIDSSL